MKICLKKLHQYLGAMILLTSAMAMAQTASRPNIIMILADDLGNADPAELNADGLGRGKAEGEPEQDEPPHPASHYISRGFSRGAAPDNLVFLPSANRNPGPAALDNAQVCAACGDIAVVRKGAALICETCGARAGAPLEGEAS